MAVLHLPVKSGADNFFQSRVIDIFSEIQDGGRRHLGFVGSHGNTHEGLFVVRKNCVTIG